MPETLIVVGHPDLSRSRINAAWVEALHADEHTTVHVLADVPTVPGFDLTAEKRLLERHSRVILQFPFHWYSAPAILHSWLAQVLERGWAYGPGADALAGKELAVAVSTWSTGHDYTRSSRYGRTMQELTSPYEVTAKRVGMKYLPGHFLNGVGKVTDEELKRDAERLVAWATNANPLGVTRQLVRH